MVGKRRRRSGRRIIRWVALGVTVLLALLYYRPVRAYVDTRSTLDTRTEEVRALTARKHQLEERLAEIRSGATLVRGARRLGLVKPGEHLFIVRGIPEWRRAQAHR
jgi:cell division protein FtsB